MFKPTALNPVVGAVKVTAAGAAIVDGSPLQLTGNGLLPAVTPASLDFGSVPVGTAVTQTLTLSNATNVNSNGQAFPFTVTVSGPGFTRPTGTAGGTCVTPLAGGATCTVVVQFQPAAAGTPTGTVTISGNSGLTVLPVVSLSGIALPPPTAKFTAETSGPGTFTAATQTMDFGNNGGGNNPTATLTLTVSGATVTFASPTLVNTGGSSGNNPTPYTLGTNTCTGTKTAGSTCQISIHLNRANNNTKTGTLSVPYTGGTGSPAVLNLTGS